MKLRSTLNIILVLLVFLATSKIEIYSQVRVGLSSIDVPELTKNRQFGLRIEDMREFDEGRFQIFDQGSFIYNIFPSMTLNKHSNSNSDAIETAYHDQSPIYDRNSNLIDVGARLESCFSSKELCLGIVPLSASIFLNKNGYRSYLSPALSLRYQYKDQTGRYWDIGVESRLSFDKNLSRSISEETNIISLGASL